MKNNETGEFELVLGNRQLLSGFFVVALLFGVAFAMGYIVGRNSTPSPKLQAETAAGGTVAAVPDAHTAPGGSPTPAETPAPADSAKPAAGTEEAAPADSNDSSPQTQPALTTQPARDEPGATAGASLPAKTAAATEPAPAETGAEEPAAGTYWQVTAIAPPQAEVFAKVLRDKGFHVSLTPGTKGLMRVLVGPYADREALGHAKSDLESAGFHPVILKKE
jgi:cell division septation protein DedD